jgi:hypothetical protein
MLIFFVSFVVANVAFVLLKTSSYFPISCAKLRFHTNLECHQAH